MIFAQGYGNGEAPCISHWSWLLAGLPEEVPGYQLDRRCGSGLQAIVNAAMMVQTGVADVVIAGGVLSKAKLPGIPGIETRLPLLMTHGVMAGRIDIHTFVALTSTNPARLYGFDTAAPA